MFRGRVLTSNQKRLLLHFLWSHQVYWRYHLYWKRDVKQAITLLPLPCQKTVTFLDTFPEHDVFYGRPLKSVESKEWLNALICNEISRSFITRQARVIIVYIKWPRILKRFETLIFQTVFQKQWSSAQVRMETISLRQTQEQTYNPENIITWCSIHIEMILVLKYSLKYLTHSKPKN